MVLTRLSEGSGTRRNGVNKAFGKKFWILCLVSQGYHTRLVDADDDLSVDNSSTLPAKKGRGSTLATTVTTRLKEAKYLQ
jgi:hypothetical protein